MIFLKLFISLFIIFLWSKLLDFIRFNKAKFDSLSVKYLLLNMVDWFVWISVAIFFVFNIIFIVVSPEASLESITGRAVKCFGIAALFAPLLALSKYGFDRFVKSSEISTP